MSRAGRQILVYLHRYVGLAITLFIIIVGATGSLLAFQPELNQLLTPRLFPPARAGQSLSMATLARQTELLVPESRINLIDVGTQGTVIIRLAPRDGSDPAFNELFLDPVSGDELGRRLAGTGLPSGIDNLVPFLFRLHYNLSLGAAGAWILGIAALLWTIDCFVSLLLTLPRFSISRGVAIRPPGFLSRWRLAWLVKWPSSTYRLNVDLHRAGGLWVWFALLVFSWSSVYMNLHDSVYAPATRMVLEYPPPYWELPEREAQLEVPRLNWPEAIRLAERMMSEQAGRHGVVIEKPVAMRLDRARHLYIYQVRSSRDIQDRKGRTRLIFDANTGEMRQLSLPTGQHDGTTVTMWLNALHDANVFGLPYRIFVSILGVIIVMLAVTGLVIWWKKSRARQSPR